MSVASSPSPSGRSPGHDPAQPGEPVEAGADRCVDRYDGERPIRISCRDVHDDSTTHGVAHEDGLLEAEVIEYSLVEFDILGPPQPAHAEAARSPVARGVDGDDPESEARKSSKRACVQHAFRHDPVDQDQRHPFAAE